METKRFFRKIIERERRANWRNSVSILQSSRLSCPEAKPGWLLVVSSPKSNWLFPIKRLAFFRIWKVDARRFARIGQSRVIALPNFVQREMDLCTLGDEFLTLTFFFFSYIFAWSKFNFENRRIRRNWILSKVRKKILDLISLFRNLIKDLRKIRVFATNVTTISVSLLFRK